MHKEHDTTKRIHITLKIRSYRFSLDSNDLGRTPSRIEAVVYGRRIQLRLCVPYDCRETKIYKTWISHTIYKYICLRLMNECNIHEETTVHTG
jgi:hypothetical protein